MLTVVLGRSTAGFSNRITCCSELRLSPLDVGLKRGRTSSQHVQIGDSGQIYKQNLVDAKSIILSLCDFREIPNKSKLVHSCFQSPAAQEKKTCTQIKNPNHKDDESMETAELFTVTELCRACSCCSSSLMVTAVCLVFLVFLVVSSVCVSLGL